MCMQVGKGFCVSRGDVDGQEAMFGSQNFYCSTFPFLGGNMLFCDAIIEKAEAKMRKGLGSSSSSSRQNVGGVLIVGEYCPSTPELGTKPPNAHIVQSFRVVPSLYSYAAGTGDPP